VSLRDLIDAKQRRTARLPILVGDPGPAMAEVAKVQAALQAHMESVGGREPTEDEAAREAQLRADARAALERQAAMIVWVNLQSLPDDEWDAMTGDLEPGENGLPDLTPIHAPLLAASCTDSELQDAEWWGVALKRPEWTDGDRASITQKLFELNIYAPSGSPGKD
jgi:hypothetical protein